jgi:nifR3 family TIM-barrel protein
MHYTEFVPVEALLGKQRDNRFWQRLDKQPEERPVVFQIFGNEAQKILQAAQNIESLEPDVIDINMGCSTRKVSGRGAGVGMMPQPEVVAETFSLLTKHLSVPVTGKIRLGWDTSEQNFLEIGRILEENGASLIAMHARTKAQKYGGQADWDAIGELCTAVSVPVIGNGDVQTPADIDRLKAYTGCQAVMIGRAAIGNPWIFARIDRGELTLDYVLPAVRLHSQEMMAYYGERAGLLQFRKHLKRYLEDMPEVQDIVSEMLQVETAAAFAELLGEMEAAVIRPLDQVSLPVHCVSRHQLLDG